MKYLTILFFAALIGCSPKIGTTTTNAVIQEVKDSVKIVERLVKVPIKIAGDTIYTEIPVNCDSIYHITPFNIQQKAGRAEIHATAKGGVLAITAMCNELRDSLDVTQRELFRLQIKRDSIGRITKTVIARPYVPKIYKWAMCFTVIALVTLLGYLIFQAFKFYKKWTSPL